jgi:hypothetical protein
VTRSTAAGTLYIRHQVHQDYAAFTSASDALWVFPDCSLFAVGIRKGGVDFDDINARMARTTEHLLNSQLSSWRTGTNELQQNEIEDHDHTMQTQLWIERNNILAVTKS